MTQIYTEDGKAYPVTVVEAGPCCVVQVKTLDNDGYEAVKIGFLEVKEKKSISPSWVLSKGRCQPCKVLKELPMGSLQVGEFITVEKFTKGDRIRYQDIERQRISGGHEKASLFRRPGLHGSTFNRARVRLVRVHTRRGSGKIRGCPAIWDQKE